MKTVVSFEGLGTFCWEFPEELEKRMALATNSGHPQLDRVTIDCLNNHIAKCLLAIQAVYTAPGEKIFEGFRQLDENLKKLIDDAEACTG